MQKNNLARNTIMLSVSSLLMNFLMFIMIPFFSSWLSMEDYGRFDLLVTYVSLIIPIINLASGEAVFRYSIDYEEPKYKKRFISNGLAIVVINMFIFTLILAIILFVTKKTILLPFYALLLGQLLNNYFQSFLRGIRKLSIYSFSSALSFIIISIAVTVFVKYFNWGLYGIILGYATGYLLGNVLIVVISKYWMYFSISSISLKEIKNLVKYSYPLIPNNISWWVMNVSDRLIINVFLGPTANGIYAIANKIPSVCSSIFGMFNISWQESASEMVGAEDRDTYYNVIYNKILTVIISLCIGVLSINFFLFDYIFDEKYNAARLYTPILITSIIFSSMAQYFGGIMISLKHPKENGISTVIGAISNILINIFIIKFIGLYAAALATLISNVLVCFFRKKKLSKTIIFKLKKESYIFMLIYLYFFVIAYFNVQIFMRLINFLLACSFFIYINRDLIIKFGRIGRNGLNKLLYEKL